jgi:hypothetical protein
VWTRHIRDPVKKADFEKVIRNSSLLLSRLKEILEEEKRSLDSQDASLESFSDPNWPYKQAFNLGQKARIEKLISLISLEKNQT